MTAYDFISLATKPSAQLCYKFHAATGTTKPVLLVFLNGIALPQTSWEDVISRLHENSPTGVLPAMLTYDRFGQGQTTDRDPVDEHAVDKENGHSCLDVARDLRQLVTQVSEQKMGISDVNELQLVLVCNSIGGAITRLYAQEYPGTVAGILFLDSVVANSDFMSIFPDPDASDFDASTLPVGVTVADIQDAREFTQRVLHPDNGMKEGLSRKNLKGLLPYSDGPQLKGPGERGPWVTVVGHEFNTFECESGAPPMISRMYLNPHWYTYNEELTQITESERSKGPLQAPGSGHFIHKDNPEFVEKEIQEILGKIL
ncbi:hypothetical protein N7456_013109 [Penicillium angulare]|uniref:AB hydrolase-1 domain-containing protein n=1 Tax=Penicillium angulare TaxID=116970 RepID=A0A9W9EKU1_9EURO|nr:hypothetical protein N7456_013109 [Penicillium angulare]